MGKQISRQRGQALVMLSLSAVMMFAAIGMVVDLGFAYYKQQAERSAAESAALAAAQVAFYTANHGGHLDCGSRGAACQQATACGNPPANPPQTNIDDGCLYAQSNGYTTGGHRGRQQVLMAAGNGSPPNTTGLHTDYWVTATIKDSIPQLFSAVFGHNAINPGIYATAGVILGTEGGCIYALDPATNNAYVESGGLSVVQATCGVYVNSTGGKAFVVSGGATLTVTGASINVVGGSSISGGSTVTPNPLTGAQPADNPYAGVPTPTISTPVHCDHTNYTLSGGSDTIYPGTYCGGITNSTGTLTFKTGLYILYGGGLTSSSSSGNLIGQGVTFYNTAGGSYSYKPITISGGGSATLSAMTSGPQAGLLFFEDPTITSSSKNTISGGSNTTFTGGMYFKNDNLVYSGGSSLQAQAVTIVADTVTISGGSQISGYNNGVGSSTPKVTLVQ
jgi:Putative Flp pilus-assembly TadE/G-like